MHKSWLFLQDYFLHNRLPADHGSPDESRSPESRISGKREDKPENPGKSGTGRFIKIKIRKESDDNEWTVQNILETQNKQQPKSKSVTEKSGAAKPADLNNREPEAMISRKKFITNLKLKSVVTDDRPEFSAPDPGDKTKKRSRSPDPEGSVVQQQHWKKRQCRASVSAEQAPTGGQGQVPTDTESKDAASSDQKSTEAAALGQTIEHGLAIQVSVKPEPDYYEVNSDKSTPDPDSTNERFTPDLKLKIEEFTPENGPEATADQTVDDPAGLEHSGILTGLNARGTTCSGGNGCDPDIAPSKPSAVEPKEDQEHSGDRIQVPRL
jgi:hypothetical protein